MSTKSSIRANVAVHVAIPKAKVKADRARNAGRRSAARQAVRDSHKSILKTSITLVSIIGSHAHQRDRGIQNAVLEAQRTITGRDRLRAMRDNDTSQGKLPDEGENRFFRRGVEVTGCLIKKIAWGRL